MSRSNNTELVNPAIRFFDWSGQDGEVRYFDKTLGEKGQNVSVEMPFKFLALDRVAQITGGIDRHGSFEGFWSNAVRNTKTQPFTVRSKAGVEVSGYYENIKNHPGVRFMQGLYIAFYDDDKQLQIGFLKLKGAALSAWFDFTKTHRNIYEGAFGITDKTKQKKGATVYYAPVFEHYAKVSDEADEAAKQLDQKLQEYLTSYFAQVAPEQAMAATANGGSQFYDNEPEMPEFSGTENEPVYTDEVPF